MVYKVFLDINIIVDFLDATRANHQDAVRLITIIEKGNCNAFVSESVLNTTAYLVRKDFNTTTIKPVFQHLLSFAELLAITNTIYKKAIILAANDLEDAVLYQLAIDNKLDYFITNDVKDLKKIEQKAVPVLQANDFLLLTDI